jgi:hypothetical protein
MFGQLLAPSLAVPLLEGLVGNLPFNKQLGKLSPLRLTFEGHHSSRCRSEDRSPAESLCRPRPPSGHRVGSVQVGIAIDPNAKPIHELTTKPAAHRTDEQGADLDRE